MEISVFEAVGHLSFFLTAVSFYLRDMLLLRVLAIASGVMGIFYNYFLDVGPLWLPIFWLAVFMAINIYRIAGILREKHAISFSDEERELFETIFKGFSPVEFMKIMRLAEWRDVEDGHQFVTEGTDLDGLRLLFNGEVVITRASEEIGRVRDGAMIGEMSFIKGGDATATVTATRPCRCIFWPKAALHDLLHRNPSLDIAIKHVFSLDLVRKLGGEVESPVHGADLGLPGANGLDEAQSEPPPITPSSAS